MNPAGMERAGEGQLLYLNSRPGPQRASAEALARVIEHCERQKAKDMAYWDAMIETYQRRLEGLSHAG